MKRKILIFALMLSLLICALAVSVGAAELVDNVYYTFNESAGTAEVSTENQSLGG